VGIPERSPQEPVAEFDDAGFVDVTVVGGGEKGPLRVRAVRP